MDWVLSLVLTTTIGVQDRVRFQGTKPLHTLRACIAEGNHQANWLTQDFMKAKWECETTDGSQVIEQPDQEPCDEPTKEEAAP